jgi:hypothetical protein
MNKAGLPAAVYLLAEACAYPKNGSVQVAAPFLKFNHPPNYWFANPHNVDSHLQYVPDAGWRDKRVDIAFVTIS